MTVGIGGPLGDILTMAITFHRRRGRSVCISLASCQETLPYAEYPEMGARA
jgi:hypothetical protein